MPFANSGGVAAGVPNHLIEIDRSPGLAGSPKLRYPLAALLARKSLADAFLSSILLDVESLIQIVTHVLIVVSHRRNCDVGIAKKLSALIALDYQSEGS